MILINAVNMEMMTKFMPGPKYRYNEYDQMIMIMNTKIKDLLYCGATWTTRASTRGGKPINRHLENIQGHGTSPLFVVHPQLHNNCECANLW